MLHLWRCVPKILSTFPHSSLCLSLSAVSIWILIVNSVLFYVSISASRKLQVEIEVEVDAGQQRHSLRSSASSLIPLRLQVASILQSRQVSVMHSATWYSSASTFVGAGTSDSFSMPITVLSFAHLVTLCCIQFKTRFQFQIYLKQNINNRDLCFLGYNVKTFGLFKKFHLNLFLMIGFNFTNLLICKTSSRSIRYLAKVSSANDSY